MHKTIAVVAPSSLGGAWPGEKLRVEETFNIKYVHESCTVAELKEKIQVASGFAVEYQTLTCGAGEISPPIHLTMY